MWTRSVLLCLGAVLLLWPASGPQGQPLTERLLTQARDRTVDALIYHRHGQLAFWSRSTVCVLSRVSCDGEEKTQGFSHHVDRVAAIASSQRETAIRCAVTNQECLRRAKAEGKSVVLVETDAPAETRKCQPTDDDCLKQPGPPQQDVEIVDEPTIASETVQCAATDSACLKRAHAPGKLVEIID